MDAVAKWADHLGYSRLSGAFLSPESESLDQHRFAPEIRSMFGASGGVEGVLCIDQIPTVCMVSRIALSDDQAARIGQVRLLCERLWNQNLARIVLVADEASVEVWSIDSPSARPEVYKWGDPAASNAWSVSGLMGGEALRGRDAWFDAKKRVDKHLLDNIHALIGQLVEEGLSPAESRRLVARVIFVTYLEDRGIVGDAYRARRDVRPLFELVSAADSKGLRELFGHLRADLNGDFLTSADEEQGWELLSSQAFEWIAAFLSQTALRSGQASLWRYDFSQIPIELIASIYETFLSSKDLDGELAPPVATKRKQGAYYTPRLLADWIIDLALEGRDILNERVLDPACGSGMLLTAAFRRVIREFEGNQSLISGSYAADFETRKRLLLKHIFGADIDVDACQLTAFSLYLALLSDLSPSDLSELNEGGHKLPSLVDNIRRGSEADFFSSESEELNRGQFSLVISNPPWRELAAGDEALLGMNSWQERQPAPQPHIPKNQIAAGFALGAADVLLPGGRVALILPVNPFVSADPTQRKFRAHLVGRFKVRKVVNFSDMRRLIFADAVHPFVVLIADNRETSSRFQSIDGDSFQYWSPKADISLSLGRLAIHGADREDLPISALIDETPQLAIRYWGSRSDAGLLSKLQRRGRIRDLVQSHGWVDAKGFHLRDEDKRRPPESWYVSVPSSMAGAPFLHANDLPSGAPVVSDRSLRKFPFEKVARLPEARLFAGPRLLWTDGAHPEEGVRAVFSDRPFSFQHSLAVLSAPNSEEGRLIARFLTVYLRSPLGLWLLFLLSSSVASERPKLHVQEALDWPFWHPHSHTDPVGAIEIMRSVDLLLKRVEQTDELLITFEWAKHRNEFNRLVYEYFGLTDNEINLVEELATYAGPAVQPTSLSYSAMARPIRLPPPSSMIADYCTSMAQTMAVWRNATGGDGDVRVSAWTGSTVPIGAAVLTLDNRQAPGRLEDDMIVDELVAALATVSSASSESLMTVPDLALVQGHRIFLIKPLVARFWLRRRAIEDAGKIAQHLQSLSTAKAVA